MDGSTDMGLAPEDCHSSQGGESHKTVRLDSQWDIDRSGNLARSSDLRGLPQEAKGMQGAGTGVRGLEARRLLPVVQILDRNTNPVRVCVANLGPRPTERQWGQGDLNPHNVAVCGF